MTVKVLVIDDSRVFRSILEKTIQDLSGFEVAGSVWSGEKAIDFIRDHEVDMITLDLEMPGKDGLATLNEFHSRFKEKMENIPVILLSSHKEKVLNITFRALHVGAFDFIPKPSLENTDPNYLKNQIRVKWNAWLVQKRKRNNGNLVNDPVERQKIDIVRSEFPIKTKAKFVGIKKKVLVIGVSTGGPKALTELLPRLCSMIQSPIVVIQHMPVGFTKSLAESLNKICTAKVSEVSQTCALERNQIYIAPGGRQLKIVDRQGVLILDPNDDEPVNGCKPSVSYFLRSLLKIKASEFEVLIMTGMGRDGADSLMALHEKGCRIIIQDEESSVVWGMPSAALETGVVDEVLSLNKMPYFLRDRLI